MKEFKNFARSWTVLANAGIDDTLAFDDIRNQKLTFSVNGISSSSAPSYIKVFLRTGKTGINLMDIASMKRATSGNAFLLVIDFPIMFGLEVQVLPYSGGTIDITVMGGNW